MVWISIGRAFIIALVLIVLMAIMAGESIYVFVETGGWCWRVVYLS